MKKCFENLDTSHLLHEVLMDSLENADFVVGVSQLGKDVEAHVSYIILQMLHQTTKPSSSTNNDNDSHILFDVRWTFGYNLQIRRLVS